MIDEDVLSVADFRNSHAFMHGGPNEMPYCNQLNEPGAWSDPFSACLWRIL